MVEGAQGKGEVQVAQPVECPAAEEGGASARVEHAGEMIFCDTASLWLPP